MTARIPKVKEYGVVVVALLLGVAVSYVFLIRGPQQERADLQDKIAAQSKPARPRMIAPDRLTHQTAANVMRPGASAVHRTILTFAESSGMNVTRLTVAHQKEHRTITGTVRMTGTPRQLKSFTDKLESAVVIDRDWQLRGDGPLIQVRQMRVRDRGPDKPISVVMEFEHPYL